MWKLDKSIVGKRFMSLTVLDEYKLLPQSKERGTKTQWKVRCDCGNEFYIDRNALFRRKVNYCRECRPRGIRHSKLYHIYHGIKQRCYNPKAPGYEIYGGKGVKMCDEWLASYDTFKDWSIIHGYIPDTGLSIDRIDSNGDYCPGNCQWIPVGENTARSNYGRQQVHSKLIDPIAVDADGNVTYITNITAFAREHNLAVPSVFASLHGRIGNEYGGYTFYSNKTRLKKCNDYSREGSTAEDELPPEAQDCHTTEDIVCRQ